LITKRDSNARRDTMKQWALAVAAALLFLPAAAHVQETPQLTVEEMVFCAAVQDRQPTGVDTAFANTVDRVYCFVKITGAPDTTAISHVWYYGDKEMARTELQVKSQTWRTWSSKRIVPEWEGRWRVDVVSSSGTVLRSGEFIIKPKAE
jgi:Protein of unknown function (DUF2914)